MCCADDVGDVANRCRRVSSRQYEQSSGPTVQCYVSLRNMHVCGKCARGSKKRCKYSNWQHAIIVCGRFFCLWWLPYRSIPCEAAFSRYLSTMFLFCGTPAPRSRLGHTVLSNLSNSFERERERHAAWQNCVAGIMKNDKTLGAGDKTEERGWM